MFAQGPGEGYASPALVDGQFAAGTKWITIRTHNRPTNGYLSVGNGVDADEYLVVKNASATQPTDCGSFWCLIPEAGGGYSIRNKAYGPEYVLSSVSTGNNVHTRMRHISELTSDNTYIFDLLNNNNGAGAIGFRFRGTGDHNLNMTNSGSPRYLNRWNAPDTRTQTDQGSAFYLQEVPENVVASAWNYTAYKIDIEGGTSTAVANCTNAPNVTGLQSVKNGMYMLLKSDYVPVKTDFTLTGIDMQFDVETTKAADQPRVLSFYAPDPTEYLSYIVVVKGDEDITNNATVKMNGLRSAKHTNIAANGGEIRVKLNAAPKASDLTIKGADGKFVWGPVIDDKYRTITYEVRDCATELSNGWYQMQLSMTDANIITLRNKIKDEEGNINTPANTLYLAPTVYDINSKLFKITGVPNYAGQEATYVYIEKTGANTLSITNTRTGTKLNGNFTFADNKLTVTTWAIDETAHPIEGPNVGAGSSSLSFTLGTVDMTQYNLYDVVFASDASSVQEVAINNSNAMGTTTLGNGSYLFMRKGSTAPVADDFRVAKGSGAISEVNIANEIITLTISEAKQAWTVKINDSNYKVVYNTTEYADGASVEIPVSADPALSFKTNCTDKFVWGPIVDNKSKTVTFEVREPAATLTAGKWYQLQLREKEGQVWTGRLESGNMIDLINTLNMEYHGSSLYFVGANKPNGQWTVNITGAMPDGDDSRTYLYVANTGTNAASIMMQNGLYFTNIGQATTGTGNNVPLVYNSTTKAFVWNTNVVPWSGLVNSYVGVGNTGSANNGNMEIFFHPVNVKAYKITGISNYKVEYTGDAKVIGSKKVANNYFLFLEDGEDFEKVGDNIDASKFSLRGTDATITGISAAVTGGYTTLTFTTNIPTYTEKQIIHRQAYYYDDLETESNPPGQGFIKEGEGMSTRKGKDDITIREQNMALFEIPVYLKQGTSFTSYMPTDQVLRYQRWYNYDTDGLVDGSVLSSLSGWGITPANTYTNGHVSGNAYGGFHDAPTLYLPTTMTEYNVGLDMARHLMRENIGNGKVEPTLAMRIVYQVRDAKIIAKAIKEATTANKFYEVHNISFPNVKHGTVEDKTLSNLLPLNLDLNNYWMFNGNGETNADLLQVLQSGGAKLKAELGSYSEGAQLQHVMMIPSGASDASGGVQYKEFNRGHFALFQYPDGGIVPINSTATVNVYIYNANETIRYNLAQFNITFIGNSEPVAVTELQGTERHPDALVENFGNPVAELTFDNKTNNEYGSFYKYPLNYKGVSYAYGTLVSGSGLSHGTYFASRGEYSLSNQNGSTGDMGSYQYYPVSNYLRSMRNPEASVLPKETDRYHLYIDAADQPGKVASIDLDGSLCPGSRLYCYGYIGCTSGGTTQNPTSILINVMGIDKTTGEEVLVYSYCPGIITLRAYGKDGRTIYASALGRGTVYEPHSGDGNYWAPWQQVGFSFSISAAVANQMKGYSIQIVNNAYNSNGADTMLDDFQIYVNPPKGDVDFTTPLCSDKVRHAKIHTDFEMLKNISVINEADPKLSATYCFLDAEIFDNFTEGELKISDMFEMDDKGNHNLKSGYSESDDDVLNIINHAFRQALVGSRYIKSSGKEDYGFHSFDIPYNFDDIPTYAYNDSKEDEVYGEVDGQGVRRLVFKENVVRGEMQMKPAEDALHPAYWPYMRPSRTYYLVFSPVAITEQPQIDAENTATQIFGIHDNCSFFGKFTTKDPLHVILDNADIESDLPIRAVCHGETTAFSFDIPALKVDKPIVDEAYCISVDSLNGKIVPESQGLNHYKYEASFKSNNISGVIKNLPYDWWMGGLKFDNETTYRGTIEGYHAAKHPTIKYDHNTADPSHTHTHAVDYKKHQEPVDISLAMQDFRFFYPDFKEGDDWGTLQVHDYDNDSGYSLLRSEINAIKDLVEKGIIILHRNTYDMPLTYEEAEELQAKELNDMMEKEMNDHILELALKLNTDPAIATLLPLKALEGTVLDKLSPDGKKRLTFEEFGNFTRDQLVDIAGDLQTQKNKLTELTSVQINAMQEGELRRVIEAALRELPDDEMLGFAKDYFPNIGHEKRAYLVVRALNILSRETVAKMPEADQQNTTKVRAKLREQMISIFSAQDERVLRKMWSDTSAKLTEEERAALLKDALHPETPKDPAAMNADGLAVLIEDALAQLTNNVIDDLKGDRYVHFTLVPIMPSQENFVDEPYIFCPEPRGVKLRITSHAPRMIDGFADMPYPEDMENVPVRLGLTQIKETKESTGKNLRIPVRGLKKAAKDGEKAIKLSERTGYYTDIFLTETDDPQYQQTAKAGMAEAKNVEGIYTRMVGKVNAMVAVYPTAENQNPDNYLEVSFENDMMFREGYTYRVGVNYMEVKEVEVEGVKITKPTISCPGEMLLDLKIVPEYQKWTASVNNDWTNDRNWARASRAELNAGNAAAGDKIDDKATDLDDASSYIDNDGEGGNGTASAFVPMYFTNVLIDKDASAPVLYIEKETEESDAYTPASRSGKTFLKGLHSTATSNAVYDMEVTPADGKGTWPVSEGDYECTLFGTYIANGVTFEPGAQLGNAHYLTYNKAWVEYELDAGRWYTLGSGLKASVAGDWYSPTAGGKQKTPHFYDINYDPANNDRFRPAYYQRSWDRGGNNIVYEKSGGTYDSFVKADWSYVYNDAAVNYSVGGFSVKPELGYMDPEDRPADGKVLVRLPKADASYTYYDKAGDIGQADPAQIGNRAELKSYRLMSDDLNADGSGTINMSVANESADNNFLLLSNPFMAAMDMDEFFAVNDGLEAQYWVVDADRQDVSVKSTDGTWITTGDGNGKYVAPLQGFFVKTKNSTNSVEASYTAGMQTVVDLDASQRPVVLQAPATRAASATEAGIIRLTAVRNDQTSTAIIMLNDNASDGNVSGEDCETFIDGNLYELPTVYTSAGNVAQTINVRQSLKMVPVGMISADDSETMLRFDISDDIVDSLYLYDAELDSITEIADGTEVMMSGNNAGRYFITDSVEDNMMTATATVQQGVYTPSGIYVGKTTKGLQPGLYIVDGVKMMVK